MSGSGKVVCVTGASGFIASWLVKYLLQRGYTVRASVRDLNDPKKTEHLLNLDGAKERLHLFKADLMEEGSFDSAIYGCDGVFHAASPVTHTNSNPQVEILDPAVKGTLNVLNSCAKAPSVKRIVFTSSMAAVAFTGEQLPSETVVDESRFPDAGLCEKLKSWYVISKILAEQAAWKFVKEKGMDMVSINPGMVIGPLLQPTLNSSCAIIFNLINGAETYRNSAMRWVHVKDVAEAHVQAFEIPSANGRYCLVECTVHYVQIVKILRDLFPSFHLPDKCADDKPLAPAFQVITEKSKQLIPEYIPLHLSLKETVESLIEKKIFSPPVSEAI